MNPSTISATLTYNGQEFPVAVQSVQIDHAPQCRGHDRLTGVGVDGARYIISGCSARPVAMRVTIDGLITTPPFVELPFVRNDRFTLAALLPKSDEDFDADDVSDWD